MNAGRIAGLVLIAAGVFVLVYHGFSYTRESHDAKIGPLELSVSNRERVDIPTWAGVAGVVAGAALLLVGSRKN
jgi:drug/metabolite transporter (DMT)-like permease